MRIRPEQARAALIRVDPARLRGGRAVGLRDGAIVALAAAGLTAGEIAGLRASAITMDRGHLRIAVNRHEVAWSVALPVDLGGRLLAWLTESRLWATDKPVFNGRRQPLAPIGVLCVLHRYQGRKRTRR